MLEGFSAYKRKAINLGFGTIGGDGFYFNHSFALVDYNMLFLYTGIERPKKHKNRP